MKKYTQAEMPLQDGKNEKNTELITQEKLKGTPFTLVKDATKEIPQYFLSMGMNRLTEPTKTETETIQKLADDKWLILTQVIIIIIERMNDQALITKAIDEVIEQKEHEQFEKDQRSYTLDSMINPIAREQQKQTLEGDTSL